MCSQGDVYVPPQNFHVTDDMASVGPVDLVIVAVKAWQLEQVAHTISPLLHSSTIVVSLAFISPNLFMLCFVTHVISELVALAKWS